MRAWVLVVVFACGKPDGSADCELVKHEPGTAAAKLSQKYPGAPVKVAATIERCIAPNGSPCERLAKIIAAIPGMMPAGSPHLTAPSGVLELCEGMPAEMQRCMLPSYALEHDDECAKIREKLASTAIEQIEIAPRGKHAGASAPRPPCPTLEIDVTSAHVTLRQDKVKKQVARSGGKPDTAALRAELDELAKVKCSTDAELTTADDVVYEEVIAIMDVALMAGFTNIGLAGRDPPVPTPTANRVPSSGVDGLKDAPVIIVTRTAVLVDNVEVARLDQDATAPVGVALAKRARSEGGLAILQADVATSMRTINQIVAGAKQHGFDNIMFAVKHE